MINNPVFGNELRKSLFRRKPVQCWAVWAGGFGALVWIASSLPTTNSDIFIWFPQIMLPIIAPAFAAGAFAKEREQRTWQDLCLTRLTTREILFGKFWAAYLPVVIVLCTLLPPVILGLFWAKSTEIARDNGGIYYRGMSAVEAMSFFDPWRVAVPMLFNCILQATFYVSFAMVCSHYCRKARVALGVSYVALAVYAIFGYIVVSAIDNPIGAMYLRRSTMAVDAGARMHLLTCGVLTIGAWVLLSVGLRFDPEK